MNNHLRNEKGLTLVEILAALVILAITLISFVSFFFQSAKNTQLNKEKLTAVQVAEEVVAEVREGSNDDYKTVGESTIEKGKYPGYEVVVEIEEGPSNLNKAVITVKADSETKKKEFTTEMYFEVK